MHIFFLALMKWLEFTYEHHFNKQNEFFWGKGGGGALRTPPPPPRRTLCVRY